MKVLVAVRTRKLAYDLAKSMGFAPTNVLCAQHREAQLAELREAEEGVLIAVADEVAQGISFPDDVVVLVGPDIDGAELAQIRARARTPTYTGPTDRLLWEYKKASASLLVRRRMLFVSLAMNFVWFMALLVLTRS